MSYYATSPLSGSSSDLKTPLLLASEQANRAQEVQGICSSSISNASLQVSTASVSVPDPYSSASSSHLDTANPNSAPEARLAGLKERVESQWQDTLQTAKAQLNIDSIASELIRKNIQKFFETAAINRLCGNEFYQYVLTIQKELTKQTFDQWIKVAIALGSSEAIEFYPRSIVVQFPQIDQSPESYFQLAKLYNSIGVKQSEAIPYLCELVEQNHQGAIDYLSEILKKHSPPDTMLGRANDLKQLVLYCHSNEGQQFLQRLQPQVSELIDDNIHIENSNSAAGLSAQLKLLLSHIEAQNFLGQYYLNQDNYEAAIHYYSVSAQQNDAVALRQLSELFKTHPVVFERMLDSQDDAVALRQLSELFKTYPVVFERMLDSQDVEITTAASIALEVLESNPDLTKLLRTFKIKLIEENAAGVTKPSAQPVLDSSSTTTTSSSGSASSSVAVLPVKSAREIYIGKWVDDLQSTVISCPTASQQDQALEQLIDLLPYSQFAFLHSAAFNPSDARQSHSLVESDTLSYALLCLLKHENETVRQKTFDALSMRLTYLNGEKGRTAILILRFLSYSFVNPSFGLSESIRSSKTSVEGNTWWIKEEFPQRMLKVLQGNLTSIKDRVRAADIIPESDRQSAVDSALSFLYVLGKGIHRELAKVAFEQLNELILMPEALLGSYWAASSNSGYGSSSNRKDSLQRVVIRQYVYIANSLISQENYQLFLEKIAVLFPMASVLVRNELMQQLGYQFEANDPSKATQMHALWSRIFVDWINKPMLNFSDDPKYGTCLATERDILIQIGQDSQNWLRHLLHYEDVNSPAFRTAVSIVGIMLSHPQIDQTRKSKVKKEISQYLTDPSSIPDSNSHNRLTKTSMICYALIYLIEDENREAKELLNELMAKNTVGIEEPIKVYLLKYCMTFIAMQKDAETPAYTPQEALKRLIECKDWSLFLLTRNNEKVIFGLEFLYTMVIEAMALYPEDTHQIQSLYNEVTNAYKKLIPAAAEMKQINGEAEQLKAEIEGASSPTEAQSQALHALEETKQKVQRVTEKLKQLQDQVVERYPMLSSQDLPMHENGSQVPEVAVEPVKQQSVAQAAGKIVASVASNVMGRMGWAYQTSK